MACNKVINDQLKKLRTEEFSRERIYRNLSRLMGRMAYVAAPNIIPTNVREVGFAGKRYNVLHLPHRICASGNMTHYPDWENLPPGEYLESKGLIIVEYKGKSQIDSRMASAPVSRILKAHAGSKGETEPLITFKFIKQKTEFVWNSALQAIELVDDKPDILYYDKNGKPKKTYPWMEEDEDTDEEQYDKVAQNTGNVEDYLDDFESTMKLKGYTQNLDELKEILEEVLERQGV